MTRYETLNDMLRDQRGTGNGIRFINSENEESVVSYADLWTRACRFLACLQRRGTQAGDELIVFSNSTERFLVAYWAAILGGIVPVPVAVGISDEHRLKLLRIAKQLRNPVLFTDTDLLQLLHEVSAKHNLADMKELLDNNSVTDVDCVNDVEATLHTPAVDDVAFIQYSSGSTSDPKGVCLTHRNVTSSVQAISKGIAITKKDVTLSWMPLTHDMGLIGFHLTPLANGLNQVIMDTGVFVRRPLLWLSKTSELRATLLCSPNFGYKHYLKLFARKPPANMDLSSIRLLLNGAEPISIQLCEEFLAALAPYGLARKTMFPVYGLAEATLAVTFPGLDKEYESIVVKRHSLRIGEPFESASTDEGDAMNFVKLGQAIDGCQYRIADNDDVTLDDGYVGNIQISGENITRGLYGDPQDSASLYTDDGWLRTGDCGTTVDGELVVTGRAKDIIFINGQNYYPHDIEEIIAQLDELELGKVVVCGAKPIDGQVEELLVFILHRKSAASLAALASKVRNIVGTSIGIEVDHVIPIKRVPKTTSGKIQRASLASAYIDGEFESVLAELRTPADHTDTRVNDEPAGDPLVAALIAICAEFSKERAIGPDDNLFEVGISSLTLTEIMLAVDEKYPGSVDINDLFDHPTIRELAKLLAAKLRGS
jgi:acyl-CoA synthetase (AMP-forming)/AMP-acid ligase II/acyl carrier protein